MCQSKIAANFGVKWEIVTSQVDGRRGEVGIFGFRCRRMEKSCSVKMIPSKDDEKPVKEKTEYCTKGQVI